MWGRSASLMPRHMAAVRSRDAAGAHSQDFLDYVHRPVCTDLAGAYGEQPTEELVRGSRGLEARESAEVRMRVVPDAGESHVHQHTVVGLECRAKIELEDCVAPPDSPITTARKDLAPQALARKFAADDWKRQAFTGRHCP